MDATQTGRRGRPARCSDVAIEAELMLRLIFGRPRATELEKVSLPSQRDRHIQMIAERGRLGWRRAVQYSRRSLGEVATIRYKRLIGRSLRTRRLPAQTVEATVGCKVMNIMTSLGMSVTRKVA